LCAVSACRAFCTSRLSRLPRDEAYRKETQAASGEKIGEKGAEQTEVLGARGW